MNSTVIQEDIAYIAWATKLANSALFYGFIILSPLGVVLNILEIIIFQMKRFKKTLMGFYFTINCVTYVIIIIYMTVFNFSPLYKVNFTNVSDLSCKMYFFFMRSLHQINSSINVVIVADRLLFILYPNKFKFQKNKKIISLILFGLFIFSFACNSPNLFFYLKVSVNPLTNSTTRSCTGDYSSLLSRGIMSILFRTTIPFIIMLIMNIILIYKVLKSKNKMRADKNLSQDLKFSFTVIATTFTFLICLLPNVVYVFISHIFQVDDSIKQRQTYTAYLFALEIMTSLVYFVNYSLNIVIQIIFNNLFKNEFFRILGPLFKKNINQTSSMENSSSIKTKSSRKT
ncbi:unnamed protein product [Brachionus calyciflorus]|uniref:G-protein coupled receptors family 1 profile domain-containing protein n=1 Tax=Brachionus calyciflorus TaxID=104777 RepID=A0A814I1C6_9BILA|nr:unnamed protein product [Brachionus calyciflorus]